MNNTLQFLFTYSLLNFGYEECFQGCFYFFTNTDNTMMKIIIYPYLIIL